MSVGTSLLIDLYGCDRKFINDGEYLNATLEEAARETGLNPVEHARYQFVPHGVTAVIIVEGSHLTISTWPEHSYAAVDIFTCGGVDPHKAKDIIKERLRAEDYELKEEIRGGKIS